MCSIDWHNTTTKGSAASFTSQTFEGNKGDACIHGNAVLFRITPINNNQGKGHASGHAVCVEELSGRIDGCGQSFCFVNKVSFEIVHKIYKHRKRWTLIFIYCETICLLNMTLEQYWYAASIRITGGHFRETWFWHWSDCDPNTDVFVLKVHHQYAAQYPNNTW